MKTGFIKSADSVKPLSFTRAAKHAKLVGKMKTGGSSKSVKYGAKVVKCSCRSEFQDKTYGSGLRLHNYALNAFNKTGGWRCSVCLTLKQAEKKVEKAA